MGKPATCTVDEQSKVHFYGHAQVEAEIAEKWLLKMEYPCVAIGRICKLGRLHMRPSEESWGRW